MEHIARRYTVIIVACVLISTNAAARSDWVHLYPLNWKIELEYDGSFEQREEFGDFQDDRFTEKVEVEQSGYIVSPKLLDFSITVAPMFTQRQHDGGAQELRTEKTTFDYDVNLSALKGIKVPVGLDAHASRGTGTYSSNLGRHTDTRREDWSVGMNLKWSPFPMTLTYREGMLEESSRSGGTSTFRPREESQQSVLWQGHSSKLYVQVEKRWFDDWIDRNDYDLLHQKMSHNLKWGKSSSFKTRQSYMKREGANAYARHTVSERLRLQHLENLYSTLDYDYSSISTDEETQVHSGNYTVTYRPSRKLHAAFGLEGRNNKFGAGIEREYGGKLALNHKRDFFWKGKLNFNLRGSSRLTDFESNGSTFESLDISHTVPATLLVLLDTRAIETDSITVTDLAGSQVFLEGVDYIARDLSGDRTELQILISGLIEFGDTILVSYKAAAQPSAEFRTDTVNAAISLDFDWVRFYHSTGINRLALQSGSFGEGQNDSLDQSTGVELRWNGTWFETSARAETRFHESGDFSTESNAFMESAQIDVSARTHLVVSASQISYLGDGRETYVNQWDINLAWLPLPGMSVKPYMSGLDRQDIGEQFLERLAAGVKFTWNIRKIELDLDVSHVEHDTQDRDWSEQRVGIRIVRRSR